MRSIRVPFALVGAVALQGYGEPRATIDVDFLTSCPPARWRGLLGRLERAGLTFDERWAKYHPTARDLVYRFKVGRVRVDYLRPADRHEARLRGRLVSTTVLDRPCPLLRPEDYILMKVKTERPRDLDDAVTVARAYRNRLEIPYLARWSLKIGRREEVQWVFAQSENPLYDR